MITTATHQGSQQGLYILKASGEAPEAEEKVQDCINTH
jgi:hypothetical protein